VRDGGGEQRRHGGLCELQQRKLTSTVSQMQCVKVERAGDYGARPATVLSARMRS
jgi:hypothetical protein